MLTLVFYLVFFALIGKAILAICDILARICTIFMRVFSSAIVGVVCVMVFFLVF